MCAIATQIGWDPSQNPLHALLDRLGRLRRGLEKLACTGDSINKYLYRDLAKATQREGYTYLECRALKHLATHLKPTTEWVNIITCASATIQKMCSLHPVNEGDMAERAEIASDRFQQQHKLVCEAQDTRAALCRLMALCGEEVPFDVCNDTQPDMIMPRPFEQINEKLNNFINESEVVPKLGRYSMNRPSPRCSDSAHNATPAIETNPQTQAKPSEQGNQPPEIIHNKDLNTIKIFNNTYVFTPMQRRVMKALYEAYTEKQLGMSQKELLKVAKSDSKRLRDVFKMTRNKKRNQMHPAWGKLVVPVKGETSIFRFQPQ